MNKSIRRQAQPAPAAPPRILAFYAREDEPYTDPGADWDLFIERPGESREWTRLRILIMLEGVAKLTVPSVRSLPISVSPDEMEDLCEALTELHEGGGGLVAIADGIDTTDVDNRQAPRLRAQLASLLREISETRT